METSYTPFLTIGPGEFIREELEERNWRQEDLAHILGLSTKTVNELVTNKQAITRDTAVFLGRAFGQSPQYWINLDANYRLRLAAGSQTANDVESRAYIYTYMPIHDLTIKGWIKNTHTTSELIEEIKRFWGIKELDLSFDKPGASNWERILHC